MNQFLSALNLIRITALRVWSDWEIQRDSVGLQICWCLFAVWVYKIRRQNTPSSFVPNSEIYSQLLHSFKCQDDSFPFFCECISPATGYRLIVKGSLTKWMLTWKLLKPPLSCSEMRFAWNSVFALSNAVWDNGFLRSISRAVETILILIQAPFS